MATVSLYSGGETIQYASASAVASKELVVIGNLLAVAAAAYAANETGVYYIEGAFTGPKVSAAVIGAGEDIIWDVSAEEFDDNAATPATGDVSNAAVALEAGIATQTTIKFSLSKRIGTVA